MRATGGRVILGVAIIAVAVGWLGTALARDLYVRAASGGDGSREKPFGCVDEALRYAYSGDVIHVAGGTYYGAGGSGKFVIDKPNLTLVGGYSADFGERQPFKHITRLMRGEDPDPKICRPSKRCAELVARQQVPQTKASYNPEAIVRGQGDHAGAVLDGFVVDGYTRHKYKPNEDLDLSEGPIGTPGVEFSKPGCKVRNCIVMNIAGPGIRMAALGTKLPADSKDESGADWAEISNCIVANTLMESIELRVGDMDERNKPDGGAGIVKNCTLAFDWEKNGENYNLIQGRQTQLTLKDNVLAFAGFGINNGFGNRFGRYIGNVFFGHSAGAYKYWDKSGSGATLVEDDVTKLDGEKCKVQFACSKQSRQNTSADPKFPKVDTFFLDKFMNQIASEGGGKVTMDSMNQWRSAWGMPLVGSAGSGVKNFAPIYDPGADWSQIMLFAAALPGKGAQRDGLGGKFQEYRSAAVAAVAKDYQQVAWDDIKPRGKATAGITAKGDQGLDVVVTLKPGAQDMSSFYLPDAAGVDRAKGWLCFKDQSMGIFLYLPAGSPALGQWKQSLSEGAEVIVKGTAYDVGAKARSPGKVGIKVDAVESTSDD